MAQYDYYGRSPFSNIPQATLNILIINVIFFVATLINERFMVSTFSMFLPGSPFFRFWQPLTYMFMHGGFAHVFFNMWALWMFGSALERAIGTKKFLVLYFVSGFGALLLHTGVQYAQLLTGLAPYQRLALTPMLGASGALFGVQIAFAMLYPNSVWTLIFPPVSLKAKWFVAIFVAIELLCGITGTADGVAHFAHLGGMLCGWLLILYWRKTGKLYRY